MLKKVYIGIGAAVCLWFVTAAVAGWKSPTFFSGGRGGSSGGGFFWGRGGGFYGGGWSGGK
jgi:hypothetical protein